MIFRPLKEKRGREKGSKTMQFITEMKSKQKDCVDTVLPDPRTVCDTPCDTHRFVTNKSNYLIPNGTDPAKVGKMGGALVQISGKVRALKMQIMETRENWADTLIFKTTGGVRGQFFTT